MAEGGSDNKDEYGNTDIKTNYDADRLFNHEDKEAFKQDFHTASYFAERLLLEVLDLYGPIFLMPVDMRLEYMETRCVNCPKTLYCQHIGEAIIAVSYANRLKFKVIFDDNLDFLTESEFNYEKLILDFVREIYVDGHVEQFLLVWGFIVDLILYFFYKLDIELPAGNFIHLFGDLFRYVMKDTFYEKGGGWVELRRQSKVWWHTYRNIIHRQEENEKIYEPDFIDPRAIDFFNVNLELTNERYTYLMKYTGQNLGFDTVKEYLPVPLDDVVPKNTSVLCPICEIDLTDEEAAEAISKLLTL